METVQLLKKIREICNHQTWLENRETNDKAKIEHLVELWNNKIVKYSLQIAKNETA